MTKALIASPIVLIVFGLAVGLVAGLFGVAGGFLMTPLLHVVLHLPFEMAVGTGVAALLIGSVVGTGMYWRGHSIHWGAVAIVGGTGALATQGGVAAVVALQRLGPGSPGGVRPVDLWLSVIYVVLLVGIGVSMLREARRRLQQPPAGGCVDTPLSRAAMRFPTGPFIRLPEPRTERISVWPLAAVGVVTGFVSGLLGIGGGFIRLPALIYVCGFPTRAAAGTSLGVALMVVLAAAVGHWRQGHVNVASAAILGAAAALGAYVGALIAARVRGAKIRHWFGLVVIATALMLILKLAGAFGE